MITAITELEQRLAGPDAYAVREATLHTLRALQARYAAQPGPHPLTSAELHRLKTLRAAFTAALGTLAADPLQPSTRP